jgi:putative chitinase
VIRWLIEVFHPKEASTVERSTLLQILPYVPRHRVDEYLPLLNAAMVYAEVTTPARIAMFLAQVGHESGSFRYMEELADGNAYEGRADLGNTQLGDGKRYKGRGAIQITGRWNYSRLSEAMGVDFVSFPDSVAMPKWAFMSAAWFWKAHELNKLADRHDVVGATRKINGGINGLADRREIYDHACKVLGA